MAKQRRFDEAVSSEDDNFYDIDHDEDLLDMIPSTTFEHTPQLAIQNEDVELEMPPNYFVFSEFFENAIGLVAGYVVRLVRFSYL